MLKVQFKVYHLKLHLLFFHLKLYFLLNQKVICNLVFLSLLFVFHLLFYLPILYLN